MRLCAEAAKREATALAITPPTGMMPPSPAPFAPNGLMGDGSSSIRNTRIFGHVGGGRHQVVGQRGAQWLAMIVIGKAFEKRAAETLNDSAKHLPSQCRRIDDPADILHRNIVQHFDMPGIGIHCDMRGMRSVAVGVMMVGKTSLRRDAGLAQFPEVQSLAIWACNSVIPDLRFRRRTVPLLSPPPGEGCPGTPLPRSEWPNRPSPQRGNDRTHNLRAEVWSIRAESEPG